MDAENGSVLRVFLGIGPYRRGVKLVDPNWIIQGAHEFQKADDTDDGVAQAIKESHSIERVRGLDVATDRQCLIWSQLDSGMTEYEHAFFKRVFSFTSRRICTL